MPEPYDGKNKGKTAKEWLMRMSTYTAMNSHRFQNEHQAMMWFLSCMEGFAADWALPHMERIIARDFTGITENMVSLEKAFLTAFGDPDAKRAAQRKLQELVQTGTIHEYTTEFRTLVAEPDLSNDGLMMDYEKGLHWRVKEALAM